MDWFKLSYTLLGGLGIFFYGMKGLSDGLQQMSGGLIRKVINSLTTNPIMAVIVGLFVTTLVQSSSITTVMIVGFVNAGLMSLSQAVGVILGANIGTTITGWIIAIKIGKYSLLLIGLGAVPLIFSKNEKFNIWGKVLFALGMIFLGLSTMSGAFKPLRTHDGFLELMTFFAAENYFSLLATIAIGCGLTFIIQSSSAMLGITIALASTGAISFQTACALVLGENIGTTITAILASIGANVNARRAALAHAIFNVFGVFVLSTIFWVYIDFVDSLISGVPDFVNEAGEKPYIAAHIAASHTLFNVVNVIIFLPLMGFIVRSVSYLVPEKTKKENKHLTILGKGDTVSASLAAIQAYDEVKFTAKMIVKALSGTKEFFEDPEKNRAARKKVLKLEKITDAISEEMTDFCGYIMRQKLSSDQVSSFSCSLRIIDALESVTDYCQKIVSRVEQLERSNDQMDDRTKALMLELFDYVYDYYMHVCDVLDEKVEVETEEIKKKRIEFAEKSEEIKTLYLSRISEENIPPMISLTIGDLVSDMGRIFSHSRHVVQYVGQRPN